VPPVNKEPVSWRFWIVVVPLASRGETVAVDVDCTVVDVMVSKLLRLVPSEKFKLLTVAVPVACVADAIALILMKPVVSLSLRPAPNALRSID
jgi:hypothetical protein